MVHGCFLTSLKLHVAAGGTVHLHTSVGIKSQQMKNTFPSLFPFTKMSNPEITGEDKQHGDHTHTHKPMGNTAQHRSQQGTSEMRHQPSSAKRQGSQAVRKTSTWVERAAERERRRCRYASKSNKAPPHPNTPLNPHQPHEILNMHTVTVLMGVHARVNSYSSMRRIPG